MEALEPGRPLSFLDHRIVRQRAARRHARADRRRHPRRRVQADRRRRQDGRRRAAQAQRERARRPARARRRRCDCRCRRPGAGRRERGDRRRRRPLARRRPRAAAALRGAARLTGASTRTARRRRLVRGVRRRQAAGRGAITQDVLVRALGAGGSLSDAELSCRRASATRVRVPALARRVPGRVGAGRLRRRARQPAVGARQAPGEGVLRDPVTRDRRSAEQAARERLIEALAEDDPALCASVRGRQARGRGREPLRPLERALPALRARRRQHVRRLRRADAQRRRPDGACRMHRADRDRHRRHDEALLPGRSSTTRSLVSLFDFENEEFLFPASVTSRMKFCLLTLTGLATGRMRSPSSSSLHVARSISKTPSAVSRSPPTTSRCSTPTRAPARSSAPAATPSSPRRSTAACRCSSARATRRQPVGQSSSCGCSTCRTTRTCSAPASSSRPDGFELDGNVFVRGDERWLPLYEAKMIHHFDHRYGDYDDAARGARTPSCRRSPREASDPTYVRIAPRYWVAEPEVDRAARVLATRLAARLARHLPQHRRADRHRGVLPRAPSVTICPYRLTTGAPQRELCCLVACVSSFALDYVARSEGRRHAPELLHHRPASGARHPRASSRP